MIASAHIRRIFVSLLLFPLLFGTVASLRAETSEPGHQLRLDLRSFYFCAQDLEASDDWSQFLLSGRHGALVDERDAYRQVCDGFSQQLQTLHNEFDLMEKKLILLLKTTCQQAL